MMGVGPWRMLPAVLGVLAAVSFLLVSPVEAQGTLNIFVEIRMFTFSRSRVRSKEDRIDAIQEESYDF